MNAPINNQKNQGDVGYCKFGFEAVLKLLLAFENQIDGVIKNDDIEYVHKTRVTSRRLRAALPLFKECFSKKDYKKWLSEIKKVTCLLGNARDLDVQIVFVSQYMDKLGSEAEKAGVGLLLKAHMNCRKRVQPAVVSGLDELKETDVLDSLREFCEENIKEQSNA
jgi:CHAD domain-containing protein